MNNKEFKNKMLFRTSHIKRLCDKVGKEGRVEEWMRESYESAWRAYLKDSTISPETSADQELIDRATSVIKE